jgi:hypothetical protein
MKQRHALRADKEALTRLFRKNPNAEIPKNLRGFHENIYNECMKFADTAEMREPRDDGQSAEWERGMRPANA